MISMQSCTELKIKLVEIHEPEFDSQEAGKTKEIKEYDKKVEDNHL